MGDMELAASELRIAGNFQKSSYNKKGTYCREKENFQQIAGFNIEDK